MLGIKANKYLATKDLKEIIFLAEELIKRTAGIPENDSPEHEDLVRGYRERIHDIKLDLDDVFTFGSATTDKKWYEEAK